MTQRAKKIVQKTPKNLLKKKKTRSFFDTFGVFFLEKTPILLSFFHQIFYTNKGNFPLKYLEKLLYKKKTPSKKLQF